MIFFDDIKGLSQLMSVTMEETRCLRVHHDVMKLADALASDPDKLKSAAPFIFMPAYRTWVEWEAHGGKFGIFFDGDQRPNGEQSVTKGFGIFAMKQDGKQDEPTMLPIEFDITAYKLVVAPTMGMTFERTMKASIKAGMSPAEALDKWQKTQLSHDAIQSMSQILSLMKPSVWAVMALINSPKIIRKVAVDVSRINKRREALGRYTFHPHHEVRLNVDKHIIKTVAGSGDGSSKCLHFVRTHLRFVPTQGNYTLVHPHWRGDPALGIRDTHYYADRQNSRWPE
jgi:hypothetical protein